ncbi:Kunitz family trypsin and protease inhibitor protein [Striga hermonthica]|uniref:Kunitz family trypsin and protease inhibitor protein n=1 Tax=Striga hermonthica TaxID=68872 RepID=A0A9N7RSV7_STRHE|nr:Kunitz family trypsin and protease inhibitor protein [Striga hermonthica]
MMKKMLDTPPLISLACLLLLLLLSCAAAQSPIFDMKGDELETGVQYRIRSATWGIREGDLTADNLDTCPLNVVLANSGPGLPVTFHLPDASKEASRPVLTSTNLNIQFVTASAGSSCNDGGVWAARIDPILGAFLVSTGGELGALISTFQIKPQGAFHKLVYCVVGLCKDLTILDGQRLGTTFDPLGSHKPLIVIFERVQADDDATIKIKMPTDE